MHFQTGQVGAEAQICLLLASFCSLPLSRDSPPPLPHPQEILSSDKNTLELMDLTYDSRQLGKMVKDIIKEQKDEEARREKEEKKRQARVRSSCVHARVSARFEVPCARNLRSLALVHDHMLVGKKEQANSRSISH